MKRARTAPTLRLTVQNGAAFADLPSRSTLRRWLRLALKGDADIVLRFVGAREARALNRAYRRRDYATNVLTFVYGQRPVRADVVLCVPVVRAEARSQGKAFRHHLAHLVLHGALHAQGHDHVRTRQARAMEAIERRLLARLGIADPYA